MIRSILFIAFLCSFLVKAQENFDYTLVTYSQVGYNSHLPKVAMLQHKTANYLDKKASFSVHEMISGKEVFRSKIEAQGKKWDKYWWKLDFSKVKVAGDYFLRIHKGKEVVYTTKKELPIKIEKDLLWNKTWYDTAIAHLKIRDSLSYKEEGGWKDCGSPLQELSSHAIMLNALCDLLELSTSHMNSIQIKEAYEQLVVGADYITVCQDKAKEIGFQEGAVIHEMRENFKVVTGNVAKTAMILARISRLIKKDQPELAENYKQRSIKAYNWISKFGPVLHWDNGNNNFAITHGAPYGMHKPPKEWMTRDLVMMMWASVELYKCGETSYKEKAVDYAQKIMARQVPKSKAEEGLYGHFYTYDSFDFTEKADIHCGAWNANYKAYNQGGHFPHYLIPLIEMTNLWPDHKDVAAWKSTVHELHTTILCQQHIKIHLKFYLQDTIKVKGYLIGVVGIMDTIKFLVMLLV